MRPLVSMAVLALGGAMILLAIMLWPFWPPAFFGVILILSALIERRYRGKADLDAGWQPTPERFIDHETGARMQVWYNPRTGQRDYRPEER